MIGILKNIIIKKIDDQSAIQLIQLLNNDIELQEKLGLRNSKISKDEFDKHNNEWAKRTSSEIFAIILNDYAIGTISLSYQNEEERKAQVGYWIGSEYWGKGYASQAFLQMLSYAKGKEIKFLSSKIPKDNIASKKIWEKYNANIEVMNDKISAWIEL